MKNSVKFFILFYFSLALNGIAGSKEKIVFNTESYNFGKLSQHQKVSTVFYYTNKSNKIINIKKVHTTCGCTVPEISKKRLKPKEKGKIKVTFNTGSFKGKVIKTIYFETDPPILPYPKINIKATIIPDIYLEPEILSILKISRSKPLKKKVKILSGKFKNFKIKNITYNKEYMKIITKRYIDTNQNLFGYIMEITIYPDKIKTSYLNEEIKIKTSIKSSKYLSLFIYGYIQ